MHNLQMLSRWQGAKKRLIDKVFKPFLYETETFIEPFAGNFSFSRYMYNNGLAQKFIINDINGQWINCLRNIKYNLKCFISEYVEIAIRYNDCANFDYTNPGFQYRINKRKNRNAPSWNKKDQYLLERDFYHEKPTAAMLYFLRKTARDGIWQTTGHRSDTLFKGSAGLCNKNLDIDVDVASLEAHHQFFKLVDFYCCDYMKVPLTECKNKMIIAADPNYINCKVNYELDFSHKDMRNILAYYENYPCFICNKSDGVFFEKTTKTLKYNRLYHLTKYTSAGWVGQPCVNQLEIILHNNLDYSKVAPEFNKVARNFVSLEDGLRLTNQIIVNNDCILDQLAAD